MFRQLKQLWREWGQGVDKDYLTAEEFWLALRKLGIELTQEDGEAMMRKFASEKDCIKFEEFVIHFLALPNNFFSQQHVKSEEARRLHAEVRAVSKRVRLVREHGKDTCSYGSSDLRI